MARGLFAGLATLDVVSYVDRAPEADEKVTATWQLLAGGGPALNAAVTFAALGGEALLLTRIGSGPAAALIRADLAACGVEVLDAAGATATPPVSSITVEADGTRRVVGLDAVTAGGEIPAVPPADVVLVDGHHPDLAALALSSTGGPRVMDAGRWKPQMTDLLPRSTHVLASAAFRLDGQDEPPEARLRRVLDRLDPAAARTFAGVTAGGGDITWIERSPGGDLSGTTTPPAVEVVDTLGAGDAMHGAYAWALVSGVDDPVQVAAAVASRSCEVRGTRDWLEHATAFAEEAVAR